MGLVEHVHPYLVELDYRNMLTKLKVIGLSSVFFWVMHLLSAAISSILLKTYRNFSDNNKAFWNVYVVHGIFGLFCCVIGVWILFYDTELLKNPAVSTNSTSHIAVLTAIGFFFYECGALIVFGMHKFTTFLLVLHHWASLVGFCIISYLDQAHYFGVASLFIDITAPFACICWILLKGGKGHSLLWKMNQFLMVHLFHIRFMVGYVLCYQMYQKIELLHEALSSLALFILIGQFVLFHVFLTPYWLYKRTQQMFKPVDWNFVEDHSKKEVNGRCKKDS